jgi:hypothetical protein
MPTFIPPTTAGELVGDPKDKASWQLLRFYGSWETGKTVWRDQQGEWHEALEPYLGGHTDTVHNWNGSTVSAPDAGLANAQVVYLGGHVHTITQQEADDLTAAGYGAYIT